MGVVTTLDEASDRALVERALTVGDDAAWGALYDRLAPAVHGCLVAMGLLSRAEVEDAVQETFLRLFRGLERFDPARRLEPFVLGIARHVAIDACRRRRAAAPGEVGELPGDGPVDDGVSQAEERAIVRAALAALDPDHAAAIALRHTARLTMRELADSLDCSVPTARARLRKAAHRFAVELRHRGLELAGAGEEHA